MVKTVFLGKGRQNSLRRRLKKIRFHMPKDSVKKENQKEECQNKRKPFNHVAPHLSDYLTYLTRS